MKYKIGDIIRIIDCPDARKNNGLEGVIQYIDNDFLYGSWSDEIICPCNECDIIEKIGHQSVPRKTTKLVEMGSNQGKAENTFKALLKQGIVHLIKLYCYRNWEQVYDYRWSDKWIATVYRNVAVGNEENEKSYLLGKSFDNVVNDYMNKFNSLFEIAKRDIVKHNYPLPILDKDMNGAEEFSKKYLDWAKPKLLQYEQINEDEVISKIYEMLNEVKD